jgi:hypothetical protein
MQEQAAMKRQQQTSFRKRKNSMWQELPGSASDKLGITHMNESSSYDDSRSKILGNEEG